MITTGMAVPRRDLTGGFREIPASQDFKAARIAPSFDVPLDQGGFGRVSKKSYRKLINTKRQADGGYPRVEGRLTDDTYKTQERGIEESLDRRNIAIYGALIDYQRVAADALIDIMKLRYEKDVADAITDTSVWALSGNTGYDVTVSSTPWSDTTNAKPWLDVGYAQKTARNNGLLLTELRVNWVQWLDLSENGNVRTAIQYTARPDMMIPLAVLAAFMNLSEIIVCTAQYNSADDGQTPTYADIWSNLYVNLMQTGKTSSIEETCLARTFVYRGDGGGSPDDPMIETYPWELNRSDVIRARSDYQVKIMSNDCNFLMKVRTA